jgi:hypothetical protein
MLVVIYATVSREIQKNFVLRVVSSISKFKTLIRLLKVFSILKHVWRLKITFYRKTFLFFSGLENRSYKNHKFNAFSS